MRAAVLRAAAAAARAAPSALRPQPHPPAQVCPSASNCSAHAGPAEHQQQQLLSSGPPTANSSPSLPPTPSSSGPLLPSAQGATQPHGGPGGGGVAAPAPASSAPPAPWSARVPLVPGTYFRVAAGSGGTAAAVRVEHVAGWSDVATLQGRPTVGGSRWLVESASVESLAAAEPGGEASSIYAGIRQMYDVRECAGPDDSPCDGNGDGVLVLAVPEKWISFDIRTAGRPVSVSKVTEANLGVATGGAAVTLGSVRGLRVIIDTSNPVPEPGDGGSGGGVISGGGHGGSEEGRAGPTGAGSVTGGELSGTSISVSAAGAIHVRRLVGAAVRLQAEKAKAAAAAQRPTAGAAVGASPAARAAPSAAMSTAGNRPPAIELGAVYGGRLHVRTGGGAVRIGTLDCGGTGGGGGGEGARDGAGAGGGGDGGGAEILSCGGAVTLDGLEGDAVVCSAGGAIKVLAQPGLRSARLLSDGGPLELALAPGTALRRLEVRRAAEVHIPPDLRKRLQPLIQHPSAAAEEEEKDSGGGDIGDMGGGSGGADSGGGVWAARLAAELESRGRGAGRGAFGGFGGGGSDDSNGGGAGEAFAFGGSVVVDAGGGVVSLRQLGWMEALRAKMEERGRQHQHQHQQQ